MGWLEHNSLLEIAWELWWAGVRAAEAPPQLTRRGRSAISREVDADAVAQAIAAVWKTEDPRDDPRLIGACVFLREPVFGALIDFHFSTETAQTVAGVIADLAALGALSFDVWRATGVEQTVLRVRDGQLQAARRQSGGTRLAALPRVVFAVADVVPAAAARRVFGPRSVPDATITLAGAENSAASVSGWYSSVPGLFLHKALGAHATTYNVTHIRSGKLAASSLLTPQEAEDYARTVFNDRCWFVAEEHVAAVVGHPKTAELRRQIAAYDAQHYLQRLLYLGELPAEIPGAPREGHYKPRAADRDRYHAEHGEQLRRWQRAVVEDTARVTQPNLLQQPGVILRALGELAAAALAKEQGRPLLLAQATAAIVRRAQQAAAEARRAYRGKRGAEGVAASVRKVVGPIADSVRLIQEATATDLQAAVDELCALAYGS